MDDLNLCGGPLLLSAYVEGKPVLLLCCSVDTVLVRERSLESLKYFDCQLEVRIT